MRWVFTAVNYAGERVARAVGEDRGGVEAQVLNLHIDRIPGEPQADLVQERWSESMGFAETQRSGDRGVRVAATERCGARRHRGSLELDPTAAEAIRIAYGLVDTDQPRVVGAPRRRVSDKVRAAGSVGFRPELEQPARDGVGDRRAIGGRRHVRGTHLRRYLAEPFVRQEEEGPIPYDGAAQCAAELVAV